jgi:hypothetical protein
MGNVAAMEEIGQWLGGDAGFNDCDGYLTKPSLA